MYIIFYKTFDNDNYENIDKKKEIITLIDKDETNTMTTTLIKKIKKYLKNKCKFNSKIKIIIKIL